MLEWKRPSHIGPVRDRVRLKPCAYRCPRFFMTSETPVSVRGVMSRCTWLDMRTYACTSHRYNAATSSRMCRYRQFDAAPSKQRARFTPRWTTCIGYPFTCKRRRLAMRIQRRGRIDGRQRSAPRDKGSDPYFSSSAAMRPMAAIDKTTIAAMTKRLAAEELSAPIVGLEMGAGAGRATGRAAATGGGRGGGRGSGASGLPERGVRLDLPAVRAHLLRLRDVLAEVLGLVGHRREAQRRVERV